MINNSGLARVIELLDADLTIIAVGTGAAPTREATQLTSELLRKSVSETFIDGNILVKELFLNENEANGTLTELGLFGDGATTTPGTGSLFASSAANIVKNNTQSLTVSFEIEVQEVGA
ncbi:hypothetical protein [Corallococcus exercitus]|uniref:Uncharacterized protein n=1 Tax=Corallococcus exercitus TaxID=2316736 RepID=A0A7Y4K226_9BACT|nr:hypothetical protein [Corallococcus exercitus]NOK15284.1 hypothetical protein [Corallococcus exercitus]